MPKLEILVCKRAGPVDSRRSGPVTVDEVAALKHEVLDYSVKPASLVALWSAEVILCLASAELSEILGCFWSDIVEEFHFDSTEWLTTESDIEEDDRIWFAGHVVEL